MENSIEKQRQELLARMLKAHVALTSGEAVPEAIEHLRVVATIAADLADTLEDVVQIQNEGREN